MSKRRAAELLRALLVELSTDEKPRCGKLVYLNPPDCKGITTYCVRKHGHGGLCRDKSGRTKDNREPVREEDEDEEEDLICGNTVIVSTGNEVREAGYCVLKSGHKGSCVDADGNR